MPAFVNFDAIDQNALLVSAESLNDPQQFVDDLIAEFGHPDDEDGLVNSIVFIGLQLNTVLEALLNAMGFTPQCIEPADVLYAQFRGNKILVVASNYTPAGALLAIKAIGSAAPALVWDPLLDDDIAALLNMQASQELSHIGLRLVNLWGSYPEEGSRKTGGGEFPVQLAALARIVDAFCQESMLRSYIGAHPETSSEPLTGVRLQLMRQTVHLFTTEALSRPDVLDAFRREDGDVIQIVLIGVAPSPQLKMLLADQDTFLETCTPEALKNDDYYQYLANERIIELVVEGSPAGFLCAIKAIQGSTSYKELSSDIEAFSQGNLNNLSRVGSLLSELWPTLPRTGDSEELQWLLKSIVDIAYALFKEQDMDEYLELANYGSN
jgi:hypothetical protein